MAEAAFRELADRKAPQEFTVASAGTHALKGHPADENALEVMGSKGIALETHRAIQIQSNLINWSDIIFVMETNQKIYLGKKYPYTRGKVFLLGEWENVEIADPYKKSREHFALALSHIEKGSRSWIEKITGIR